jgi:hypothetical protein
MKEMLKESEEHTKNRQDKNHEKLERLITPGNTRRLPFKI